MTAVTSKNPTSGGERKRRQGRTPNDIARAISAQERLISDSTGAIYRYAGGCWREVPPTGLDRMALDADGASSTSARRSEIVKFLRASCYVAQLKWSRVDDDEVPCANLVVNVRSGDVRPHNPDDYLDRVLPVPHRLGARCPVWFEALCTWFGRVNSEEAQALQEFMGYTILPHAKFKKALLLYGASDCGKSVIAKVLRLLVGTEFCCQLSVDGMDDPRRRIVLKGKALNVITELPERALLRDDGFKALVSQEDPVMLDGKYKEPEMYLPSTKHLIATNHMPRVNDRTEPSLVRLVVVPMPHQIPAAAQDPQLGDKLAKELPGILQWSLEGAKRLVQRAGRFTEPVEGLRLLADLREETNPMGLFLRENCTIALGAAIPVRVIRTRFNLWNADRPLSPKRIGTLLRRLDPACVRDVRFEGRVLKALVGYRLLDESMPTEIVVDEDATLGREATIDAWRIGQVKPGDDQKPY